MRSHKESSEVISKTDFRIHRHQTEFTILSRIVALFEEPGSTQGVTEYFTVNVGKSVPKFETKN